MKHTPISAGPQIERRTVMQGQVDVSTDTNVELTTVLGSCVATCLFDDRGHVGGMNHFLLAEPPASQGGETVDVHYGVYLMELLINKMLAAGARKSGMRAQVFGGANLHAGMAPIGSANAAFARNFLEKEGIPIVRESLGGSTARRVDLRPAQGLVRCRIIENPKAFESKPKPRPVEVAGDVELF